MVIDKLQMFIYKKHKMGKNRTRKRYKNKRRSIDKLLTKYENILLAVFYVINSKILLQIYIKDGKI